MKIDKERERERSRADKGRCQMWRDEDEERRENVREPENGG